MKKFMYYFLAIVAMQMVRLQVYTQINYYGVSGNMVVGDFDNDGLLDDIAAFNPPLPHDFIVWFVTNKNIIAYNK